MKNYINSRIQAHNNLKIFNAIKHNLRHTQISLSQINKNSNYIFLDGNPTKITSENKKELYTKITNEYKKDRAIHNELFLKNKTRNLKDDSGSWGEGVFTFSEQMKEDIKNKKYTFNDLSNIALECLKDYEEYLGIKTKFMILHLDEKTPHFQYFFTNFNDKGASITHLNKTTDRLSPLQDIAHKHFGKLGIERGLKKDFTNSKHMSAAKYWQTLGLNLKDKTLSLEEQYNNRKIEVEKDLKSLYTEVNLQKNEVKDLRSNYDRTSQEYKDLTIVFKQLQVEEKTLPEKAREFKDLDLKLTGIIELEKDISRQLEEKTKELNEAKDERMRIYEGTRTLDETHKALLDEIGNNQKGLRKEIEALRNQRKDIRYILSLENDIEQFKAFIDFKNLNQEFEDFKQGNSDTKKIDR